MHSPSFDRSRELFYLRDDLVLKAARAFETARPWPALDSPRVRHQHCA